MSDTPLHDAAWAGLLQKMQDLITNGANVHAKGRFGRTPLHYAGQRGHTTEGAQLLITKGANVHAKDDYGGTPLHYAAEYGCTETAQVLITKGADVHAKNNTGWTPLHKAAINGHTELAQDLIINGADVLAKDDRGQTPLHNSAEYGRTPCHAETAQLLITKGADVHAKNNDGKTPLSLARSDAMRQLLTQQQQAPQRPRPTPHGNQMPKSVDNQLSATTSAQMQRDDPSIQQPQQGGGAAGRVSPPPSGYSQSSPPVAGSGSAKAPPPPAGPPPNAGTQQQPTLASHISKPPTVPQILRAPLQAMLMKVFAHNPEDRGTAASHLKDPYFANQIPSPAPTAADGSVAASAFPQWLLGLDVDDHVRTILMQNQIDERSFKFLGSDDIKEMGIAMGPRLVLLNAIAEQKNA